METRIAALKLGALALTASLIAGAIAFKTGEAWLEHRRLSSEVAQMEREYQQQLQQLGTVLSEEARLRTDAEAQQQMLIDRFGYTRPDETPIVIMDDEGN